jgi:hypothetical protein
MTSRKQEDTGTWRKLRIALFGELSLEEAMDLPQDRLLLDLEDLMIPLLKVASIISKFCCVRTHIIMQNSDPLSVSQASFCKLLSLQHFEENCFNNAH